MHVEASVVIQGLFFCAFCGSKKIITFANQFENQ